MGVFRRLSTAWRLCNLAIADRLLAICEDNVNVMLVQLIAALYRRVPIVSGLTPLSFNLMRDFTDPTVATLKDGKKSMSIHRINVVEYYIYSEQKYH